MKITIILTVIGSALGFGYATEHTESHPRTEA